MRRVPESERGGALLTVLLLVAVMSALSVAALEKLRLSTRLAANGAAAANPAAFRVSPMPGWAWSASGLAASSSVRPLPPDSSGDAPGASPGPSPLGGGVGRGAPAGSGPGTAPPSDGGHVIRGLLLLLIAR